MRTKLRSKLMLLFMAFAMLLAMPAAALAADLASDVNADLSSSALTPTEVPQGTSKEFKIKVWLEGNLPSSSTGTADVVTKYSMSSTSPYAISASTTAADRQTINFKQALVDAEKWSPSGGFHYKDCAAAGNPKGCSANPFEVTATLAVPNNVPVNTLQTLKVDFVNPTSGVTETGTSGDTGNVKVVAPPVSNTAPSVSVNGVTNGASYEIGSVPSASCSVTDEDTNASATPQVSAVSGSFAAYGLGSQTVTCSYTNSGDLTGSDSKTYSIVDTGKPSITDRGVKSGTIGTNSWYTSAVTNEFRASDSGAGFHTANPPLLQYDFTKSSGTTEGSGVKINSGNDVEDVAGNKADPIDSAAFKIDLSDPTNIQFVGGPNDNGSYDFNEVPAAPTCEADDAVSGIKGCVVTGYSNAVGAHTLTATATDNAGRASTEQISYTVRSWRLAGLYAPVDYGSITNNIGSTVNTVKNGSTVPLKFELFKRDANGTELTDTSLVNTPLKATKVNCASGATEDAIELTATGATSLRYDATGGQFIYNWQTPKQAGACYNVSVSTKDGSSTPIAQFKLK